MIFRKLAYAIWMVNWFLLALIVALLLAYLFTMPRAYAQDVAVGDSIALGTGRALRISTYARQNMGSCWIAAHLPYKDYAHVLVSAGINDPPGPCVETIIAAMMAISDQVTVILPAPISSARGHVAAIAAKYHLTTISYLCAGPCTTSNFHPRSYAEVARNVRAIWYATGTTRLQQKPTMPVLQHYKTAARGVF